ncbi:hypothetical protein WL35_16990 [Burkholderia ubonensis]|uniref:H-NS histone family protein n=1 Tax=Burkholderia ubonensis TaxID=101571 RepID=UPI0007562724|nr:H-NS histone family protein [Burkholderia ubonensis]KWB43879.1 hypothetical protein WL35_16990 [Burkholderia ubonensis]
MQVKEVDRLTGREALVTSYKELLEKRAQIDAEIASARDREREVALAEIKLLVIQFEITQGELSELLGALVKRTARPKYWNPTTGETWSGRGRRPKWLSGVDLEAHRLIDSSEA